MTENTLLDADSHVSEPLNLWQERLPVKYRDIAPHMETEYQGRPGAWWFIEQDRQPHNVILGFGANKSLEELQQLLKSFSYAGAHRGGWDPAQRVKDMDQDGVAGDVLYTTLGFRMFWIRDAGFQRACFQVYNDWLAEFCAYSPKRLKGLALISLYDPKQAAEDSRTAPKKAWRARWCGLRRRKSCRFTPRITIPSGQPPKSFRCLSACTSLPAFSGSIGTRARRKEP